MLVALLYFGSPLRYICMLVLVTAELGVRRKMFLWASRAGHVY